MEGEGQERAGGLASSPERTDGEEQGQQQVSRLAGKSSLSVGWSS